MPPLCDHCGRQPTVRAGRFRRLLCAHCQAVGGVAELYRNVRHEAPQWTAWLKLLATRAARELPLFEAEDEPVRRPWQRSNTGPRRYA
jgi:hypothetical protein